MFMDRALRTLSAFVEPLFDHLFVLECFHCGARLTNGEQRICSACWNTLTPVRPGDHTLSVLQQRFAEGGSVDGIHALCYFEKRGLLQTLAHGLKYQETTAFGFELGRRLAQNLPLPPSDAIVPVPLNRKKLRERGYNQSDWLAKGIASVTGMPVWTDAVTRVKYTVTQTHLNAEERKVNIAQAFIVPKPAVVEGRTVLLVDDIITTGSTIQEVAGVLRMAGAASVHVAAAGLAKLGEGG